MAGTDYTERVRQNIIRLRQKQGLTLMALAEKCGMSKGFLSEIESGKKSPTIRTLSKIADALDVPLVALVK